MIIFLMLIFCSIQEKKCLVRKWKEEKKELVWRQISVGQYALRNKQDIMLNFLKGMSDSK